jgi:cyclophilin family peptidyl-prolyl cis-trans isomerase
MPRRLLLLFPLVTLLTASVLAGPPIARFQSVLGDFDVLLDPAAAPISVTNFAAYANRGDYDTTIIHRSTTGNPLGIQVVQGGGFELVGNNLDPVITDPPIPLEAGLPNSRGTIAMARSTSLNSATSQWYFNVQSNPRLDFDYAVFGRVIGAGQSVIDAMGRVMVYNASQFLGPTFSELPLFAPSLDITNLVLINSIRVEPFAITNITRTANTTQLRWTALSTNTPVRIERTDDLTGEPWTIIASNNTTGTFTDTTAPTRGAYYRIVTEP